jgi:HEAT repeat protein
MLRLASRGITPALALLVFLSSSVTAQDTESLFESGVDAYRRGDNTAAIEQLKSALATNPGNDAAFALWQRAEQQVLLEMLIESGELGALTERFLTLAKVGQLVVVSDPGNAEEVVALYLEGDANESRAALLDLQATYGAWAVPALVGPLGDRAQPDNRVMAIQALIRLGDTAVPALMATTQAEDELTRSNAASVLGSLGDTRAAAALAWMAQTDASETARNTAAAALNKLVSDLQAMHINTLDATALTLDLSEGWLRGDAELERPYASGSVAWMWSDGALQGRTVPAGLVSLDMAESALRGALAAGAGDGVRGHLAAVHAAQKAEIMAALSNPRLADNELIQGVAADLATLDLNLALAGQHRADALGLLLASRQTAAAIVLMDAMGRSRPEVQAMRRALAHTDPGVATAAAVELGGLGDASATVVARLSTALSTVPDRLVMSMGDTGLSGQAAGWQLLGAQDVPGGMATAKAYPPKDVIVVQDGLQGVTLDTLVFGLKNDPRTQDTPLIIVTDNVGNVESLYGDQAAAIVGSASWDSVKGVAGEPTEAMARAMATAQLAAAVLSSLPAARVQAAAQSTAEALNSGADEATKIALLNLAGGAGLTTCLPAAEGVVLNGGSDELMIAALDACARLWSVTGPAGDRNALTAALENALASGNAALAYSAAEALGQLGGSPALVVAGGN